MPGQWPPLGGWAPLGAVPDGADPAGGFVGADVGSVVPDEPLVPCAAAELDELAATDDGVFVVDEVAAKATPVPTPASTPVSIRPAIACLVRSFMSIASLPVASDATEGIFKPAPAGPLWNRSAACKKIVAIR